MGQSLNDLIVPGAPILVTAGSESGARMMVMEVAWGRDVEPRELDLEFYDAASLDSAWASFNPGDFVLVTGAYRAEQSAQERMVELMNDSNKSVVVADREPPESMPPEKFAHWAKF